MTSSLILFRTVGYLELCLLIFSGLEVLSFIFFVIDF